MKPVYLVLSITLVLFALSVTAWIGRYRISVANPQLKPVVDTSELPIPEQGPFGNAVATEQSFNFGVMEKGDKGSHTFVIRNEGQGPLRVKKGSTSCGQCTFGAVSRTDDIPPGETVEVTVNWELKSDVPKFRQTADVYTTDPDHKKLTFAIDGIVDRPLRLIPEGTWSMGDLNEYEPTVAEGTLFSTLVDDIEIEKVECDNPLVNVTWERTSAEELAKKKGPQQEKPKVALVVKVAVAPNSSVGPLRETIKLHTNVRGGSTVEISLTGRRPGPIEVKGRGFNAENNVVKLGEFPAAEGKKAKLQMYVRNLEGELEAQHIEAEDSRVKVQVASTGRMFGKSKVYDIDVEVPPGVTAIRRDKGAEPVVLKLNHPAASEYKMYVDYYAR